MPPYRPISTTLAVFAAVCVAGAAGDADPIAGDRAVLTSPANGVTSQVDRDAAAVRLAASETDSAKQAITGALADRQNLPAQLATVRALRFVRTPDPATLPALAALLGVNKETTEAAAMAVANYRSSPQALATLEAFINKPFSPTQADAVAAIGTRPDLDSAGYLVTLVSTPNRPDAVRSAADSALCTMTRQHQPGGPASQWLDWWAGRRGMTAEQFKADLADGVARSDASRFAATEARDTAIGDSIKAAYRAIPRGGDGQDQVILVNLRSADAAVRRAGADLVNDEFSARNLPPVVRERVRAMVGDDDAKVRLGVVSALSKLRYREAAPDLVRQLALESDPAVTAKIAEALGKLGDPSVVPKLLDLFSSGRPETVEAAGRAVSAMGPGMRGADPTAADRAGERLIAVIGAQRPAPPAGSVDERVRAATVSALAGLADPTAFPKFTELLGGGEPPQVRAAALRGFAILKDTRADAIVGNELGDPDDVVRLEAASAFRTTSTPNNLGQIYDAMKAEQLDDVREKLVDDFVANLSASTQDKVQNWADRCKDDRRWDWRLAALRVLATKFEAAANGEDVADNLVNMSDALMELRPPQPAEAVKTLQGAIDYWETGPGKGAPGTDVRLESLVTKMIADLVAAKQFGQAATFGSAEVKAHESYRGDVGPALRKAAEELRDKGDKQATIRLVDEIVKMNPPLDDRILNDIKDIGTTVGWRGH